MEIKQDSWHHKFYSLGHNGYAPFRTNLCNYFWRTVFGMFLATVICGFALIFLAFIGFMAYMHTAGFFMAIGGLVAFFGLVMLNEYWRDTEPGLLRAYLRARKEKVCPLVEIV